MLRPAYPIQTARLTLRPFSPGDLEELFAFHSLPEVARLMERLGMRRPDGAGT